MIVLHMIAFITFAISIFGTIENAISAETREKRKIFLIGSVFYVMTAIGYVIK